MRIRLLAAMAAGLTVTLVTGCGIGRTSDDHAISAINKYGCGSCHTIPGVSGANGMVGPSLAGIGSRTYVAGSLANQPTNIALWIRDPKSVNSKTAMPNLAVGQRDADEIADYLDRLK
jgi:cytochrome c